MSREIDPRFPPKQFNTGRDRKRWVVIASLPRIKQGEFWAKVKNNYPDIAQMRRDGAVFIKDFNANFQIPEDRYKQIMGC